MFCAGLVTKIFQIYYKFSKLLLLSGYAPKPRMKYRCCYRVGDFQHCPTCLSMRSSRLFRFFFSVRCEILLLRIVRYLVRQFYEHFFSNFQTKIFFPLQNVFQIEFLRWPLRKIISFFFIPTFPFTLLTVRVRISCRFRCFQLNDFLSECQFIQLCLPKLNLSEKLASNNISNCPN